MLVTQHAICKEISCATCYWAHGLDSGDDHYNCLTQDGGPIYDFPEFTVCPSHKEDLFLVDKLQQYLSAKRARTSQRVSA